MSFFAIQSITILEQHKTLSGAKIYYVRVLDKTGQIRECGVQLDNENIASTQCDPSQKELAYEVVNLPKKRTLQASIKALAKAYPNILFEEGKGRVAYWQFWLEDDKQRKRKVRAKREWKVHEVAYWSDGFFLARLSCNKSDKHSFDDTQFILFPAFTPDGYYQQRLDVASYHDSYRDTYPVDTDSVRKALDSERHWARLSETLHDIHRGYNSELEAKAGFQKVLKSQPNAPKVSRTFKVRNATQQVATDTTLNVRIVDHYIENHNVQAWLFECDDCYYIMHESYLNKGFVELALPAGERTALLTPEKTAQHLVTLINKRSYPTQINRAQALEAWQTLIEKDMLSRYRSSWFKEDWCISHIAVSDDQQHLAIRADIVYHPRWFALPLTFKPITHFAMVIEGDKVFSIFDHGRTKPLMLYGMRLDDVKATVLALATDTAIDDEVEKLVEAMNILVSLQYLNDIEPHWQQQTDALTVTHLEAGACNLPLSFHQANQHYLLEKDRFRIKGWMEIEGDTPDNLDKFEAKVKAANRWPKQLLQVGVKWGAINSADAKLTPTHDNFYSDVLLVDDEDDSQTDILTLPVMEIDTTLHGVGSTSAETGSINPLEESIINRHITRERKWKDDKERKREWARKKRAQEYAERKANGIKVDKPGRKKEHVNAAARTRHYRFNKKYTALSQDAALIVIDWQHALKPNKDIEKSIGDIIPFYKTGNTTPRVYATRFVNTSDSPQRQLQNDTQCDEVTSALAFPLQWVNGNMNNVYIKSSLSLPVSMLKMMRESDIQQWHLCGMGLSTHLYGAALSMFDAGIQPYFHINMCLAKTTAEKKLALDLLKTTFGKHCILR
jgi:hypothetical protein